jgi:hypothetical protein
MENTALNPLLKETFVFKPFDNCMGRGITATEYGYRHDQERMLRYADGQWLPYNGEYDIAFAHGVFAYYVSLPDYSNIIWSWRDLALTRSYLPKYLHKYAKAHHIYTTDNLPMHSWDNSQHPNEIAGKLAMDKVSSIHGVANGRGSYLCSESPNEIPWLKGKHVLIQSTMQPVIIPENPICYLCLDNGKGHLIEALHDYKEQLESDIEYAQEDIGKAESTIADSEYTIRKANELMPEVIEELNKLGAA